MKIERTLLPRCLLDLIRHPHPNQPVPWLKLLHRLVRVVDEREASALAATKLRAEAKHADGILARLVKLRQLRAQLVLRDVRPVRVEDVTDLSTCQKTGPMLKVRYVRESKAKNSHDHLLPAQEWVADEFARAQRHLRISHVERLVYPPVVETLDRRFKGWNSKPLVVVIV